MANTQAVRKPPTRQLPAPATAVGFLLASPTPTPLTRASSIQLLEARPNPLFPVWPLDPSPVLPSFLPFLKPPPKTPASLLPCFLSLVRGSWTPSLTLQGQFCRHTVEGQGREAGLVKRSGRGRLQLACYLHQGVQEALRTSASPGCIVGRFE